MKNDIKPLKQIITGKSGDGIEFFNNTPEKKPSVEQIKKIIKDFNKKSQKVKLKSAVNFYELNIGNNVKCRVSNDAEIYQILALDGWNQRVMLDGVRKGEWYPIEKIKPVKLTIDSFTKFLFEEKVFDKGTKDEFIYYTKKFNDDKYCDLCLISGDKNGFIEACLMPYDNIIHYQYEHQVQNVFSGIVGERLI